MKTTGELNQGKIIISKKKDVGRLSQRSKFGKQIKNDVLEISLLEGLYLVEEEKLKVFQDKKNVSFQKLLIKASEFEKNLDLKYLVFKDLRNRGKIIKIDEGKKHDFYCLENKKTTFLIKVFSEKTVVKFDETLDLIKKAEEDNVKLYFAVVDEEGDITYYDLKRLYLKGQLESDFNSKFKGWVFENSVVIFDKKKSKKLFDKEFFGKPYGSGLKISFIEAMYLIDNNILTLENMKEKDFKDFVKKNQDNIDSLLNVYKDLKKKGLIVKTGFKFGVHFRAYSDKPDKTHAEYMIQNLDNKLNFTWSEISRTVRLSHTVNKNLVFSYFNNGFEYVKIKRIRP